MFKNKPKFAPGGKIFAKVRGYPPWPARIEGLADETPSKMRYHVYFYGTGETGVIKAEDAFSFVENKARFGKPKKLKNFTEALLQIEAELSPEEVKQANEIVEKTVAEKSGTEKSAEKSVTKPNTLDKTVENLDTSTQSNSDAPKSVGPRRSSISTPKLTKQPTPPIINSTPTQNNPKPKEKKRKAEEIADEPDTKKSRNTSTVNITEADTTSTPSKVSETPTVTKVSPEVMSRSGRKIKPKRFADFEDGSSEENSKVQKPVIKPKDEKDNNQENPDDFIVAGSDEKKVKIPLKLNRPTFCDEKSAEMWDDMVLKYANSLKKRIESGENINDLHEVMNEWTAMKSFEFSKERAPEEDKHKFDFLHTESQLLEIDINIKSALNLQKAQPEKCITLLDKLNELKITPLMLKKHPELVHTIKKMRKYVGNIHRWNMTEEELETFKESAGKIRIKSEHIYNKFKSLFLNPDINNFWDFFNKEVERFQEKTRSLSLHQLFTIVQEPE